MQEYHHVVAHCLCYSEFAGIDSHVFTKKNYHGIYIHVLQEQKYILLQFARLQYHGLINSLMVYAYCRGPGHYFGSALRARSRVKRDVEKTYRNQRSIEL
jgi:hypothetical protein